MTAKVYTLREALDVVGRNLFGDDWTGEEAEASAPQPRVLHGWPTDEEGSPATISEVKEALRENANRLADAGDISAEQREENYRRIDEALTFDRQTPEERAAWERQSKAASKLREIVRLDGIPVWIDYRESGHRRAIGPAEFAAPLGPLNLNFANSTGCFASDAEPGDVVINRTALNKCLGIDEAPSDHARSRGGRQAKYDTRLQAFIDQLCREFAANSTPFSGSGVKSWLENYAADVDEPYEPGILGCEGIYFEDGKISVIDAAGVTRDWALRSLDPYIKRARANSASD